MYAAFPFMPAITLESLMPPPLKPITLQGHPLLGTWYYGEHSREISADGYCTLRMGDEVVWKRRCTSKGENSLMFEGELSHQLEGDVLNIEGRYRARRR